MREFRVRKQHKGKLKGLRYDSVEHGQMSAVVNTAGRRMVGEHKLERVL